MTGTNDEATDVDPLGKQKRVAHGQDGRGVDDNPVVILPQITQQLAAGGLGEQLRGIRRNASSRQDGKILHLGDNHRVGKGYRAEQHLGQARFDVFPEKQFADRRFAEVGIDEQGPEPLLGEGGGKVGAVEGLSLARNGTGDEENPVFVAPRDHGQGGAHGTESLGDQAAAVSYHREVHAPAAVRRKLFDKGNGRHDPEAHALLDLVDGAQ